MSNSTIFILESIWSIIYFIFIKPSPSKLFSKFYILLVNLFGGSVSYKATIYSSAKIKRPWKLIMKENSCLGPFVDCTPCS